MNKAALAALRCPLSAQPLDYHDDGSAPYLQTRDGRYRYPIEGSIAMLLPEHAQSSDSSDRAKA